MKPIYAAVFLNDESSERLKAQFSERHGHIWYAHHMTIKFRPSEEEVAALDLGQKVALTVRSWVTDWWSCIAVEVVDYPSSNAHPHITVQCMTGITPAFSNSMLEQHTQEGKFSRYLFEEPVILHGRVGIFDAKTQKSYFGNINEK